MIIGYHGGGDHGGGDHGGGDHGGGDHGGGDHGDGDHGGVLELLSSVVPNPDLIRCTEMAESRS